MKPKVVENPHRGPGPRGQQRGSKVALPHPQSRTETSESIAAPKRGRGTREVLIVGRRDLMAKGAMDTEGQRSPT